MMNSFKPFNMYEIAQQQLSIKIWLWSRADLHVYKRYNDIYEKFTPPQLWDADYNITSTKSL